MPLEFAFIFEMRRYLGGQATNEVEGEWDGEVEVGEGEGARLAKGEEERTEEEDMLDVARGATVGTVGGECFLVLKKFGETQGRAQPNAGSDTDYGARVDKEVRSSPPVGLERYRGRGKFGGGEEGGLRYGSDGVVHRFLANGQVSEAVLRFGRKVALGQGGDGW